MRSITLLSLPFLLACAITPEEADGSLLVEAVAFDAVVDRVEEQFLVLDHAPFGSINLPHAFAPELGEGDAVLVEIMGATMADAFEVIVTEAANPRLRLEDVHDHTRFGWPAELAPPVATGDRLWMRARALPDHTAQVRRDVELRRSRLLDP